MPHQRGEQPHGFSGRGGHGMLRDSRSLHSLHSAEFQRRRLGPMMVHHSSSGSHHPSTGATYVHANMYHGPHPRSPAWYSSVAGYPHRVPGSLMSVTSGESMLEEHLINKREAETADSVEAAATKASDDLREKQHIIHEAQRRHIDDDNSIGTNEADAASALLIATATLRRVESSKVSVTESKGEGEGQESEGSQGKIDNDEGETSTHQGGEKEREVPTESSGPLKKRRKLLDFSGGKSLMTTTAEKLPLHVSPLPSPEVRTRVTCHDYTEGSASMGSPHRTAGSSSTSLANSCDMKETQCLHGGVKIKDAAEISPPSQVVIQHFPTVLHKVLTSSDFAGSVVRWLPDGKAWKILRWDALRRKVLPTHFSMLQDEDGKVSFSIDAFLWHLAGWGFEEVQSGPNVGAYSHQLFRRDLPQLCRQMNFSTKQNELDSPTTPKTMPRPAKVKKASQPNPPNPILQVPSLASSASRSEVDGSSKEAEQAMKWREEHRSPLHSPTIVYSSMPGCPIRHPDAPFFVNYHMGDVAYSAEGWQYFPESCIGMRHVASGLTGYEQRLIQQQAFDFAGSRTLALHFTPRVQSGRGAMRHAAASKVEKGKPEKPAVRRSSFPVSNRGKGAHSRPAACRISVPLTEVLPPSYTSSKPSSALTKSHGKPEETDLLLKFGEEVAERVDMAISKKTKRKLPLSIGNSTAAAEKPEEKEKFEISATVGV